MGGGGAAWSAHTYVCNRLGGGGSRARSATAQLDIIASRLIDTRSSHTRKFLRVVLPGVLGRVRARGLGPVASARVLGVGVGAELVVQEQRVVRLGEQGAEIRFGFGGWSPRIVRCTSRAGGVCRDAVRVFILLVAGVMSRRRCHDPEARADP